ncbi:MAG: hypothetical protein QOF36_2516 [Microbacteriaceae bacterium]|jgi:transcriptional regulator with XRE-family HTH domain|nr:hypothetical protein [Microbacteriaceae bacterium]
MAPRRKGKQEKLASALTIGGRISDYRQKKGLSYDDLIEACKGVWRDPWRRPVTKSYLQKLEKGKVRDLSAHTDNTLGKDGEVIEVVGGFPAVAARLCKAFGCTPLDLLEER